MSRPSRRRSVLAALPLYLAAIPFSARAHSMYQGAVLLDFHGAAIDAELQLPVERVETSLGLQLTPSSFAFEQARITASVLAGFSAALPAGQRFRIEPDGAPHLASIEGARYVISRVRLIPPAGADADLFDLRSDVLLDRIPSQVILVSTRTDWRASTFADDPQLLGVMRAADRTLRVDRRDGSWWHGFGSVFRLGMRHISEGTDHLLFLLALLLPAPLLAARGRWAAYSGPRQCLIRIGKVVTAFTAGHSVTLAAGALNFVHVPSRPIETLIAVSILVSAIHALRPLFPGREAIIAGSFGLVHGLAFATTLAGLGLGRWERVASIFGFNLGIEAMQLIVVAGALPSLFLLSRTRLYPAIRIGAAAFAGIVASAWILERLFAIHNPADALVAALAGQAVWIALGLTLLGFIARISSVLQSARRAPHQGAVMRELNIQEVTNVRS